MSAAPRLSRQKILGYYLLFFLLVIGASEVALRIAGGVYLVLQHRGYSARVHDSSETRILCIGESTTAVGLSESYPSQLQAKLEAKYPGRRFAVANEGLSATTTSAIVERLPGLLLKYKPQIVIFMMGINDFRLEYGVANRSWLANWVRDLRIFKFFRYLGMNFSAWRASHQRTAARDADPPEHAPPRYPPLKDRFENAHAQELFDQGTRAFEQRNFSRAAELFKAAVSRSLVEVVPPRLYNFLGRSQVELGLGEEAIRNFECYVTADPSEASAKDVGYYYFFGSDNHSRDGQEKAFRFLSLAERRYSEDIDVETVLGTIYARSEQTWPQAETRLLKGVRRHARVASIYNELARIYLESGRNKEAEEVLLAGVRQSDDMMAFNLWSMLVRLYVNENRIPDARRTAKQALERFPGNPMLRELMGEYFSEMADQRSPLVHYIDQESTQRNYHQAIRLARLAGARPVVMQYPNLELLPLKQALASDGELIFVSNEENFAAAARTHSWSELFTDRFEQKFGHFSPYSAGLVADAVVQALEKNGASAQF